MTSVAAGGACWAPATRRPSFRTGSYRCHYLCEIRRDKICRITWIEISPRLGAHFKKRKEKQENCEYLDRWRRPSWSEWPCGLRYPAGNSQRRRGLALKPLGRSWGAVGPFRRSRRRKSCGKCPALPHRTPCRCKRSGKNTHRKKTKQNRNFTRITRMIEFFREKKTTNESSLLPISGKNLGHHHLEWRERKKDSLWCREPTGGSRKSYL